MKVSRAMHSVTRTFAMSAMLTIAALWSGCITEASEQADDGQVVDLPAAPAIEAEAVSCQKSQERARFAVSSAPRRAKLVGARHTLAHARSR